jgi:hypothetical protein
LSGGDRANAKLQRSSQRVGRKQADFAWGLRTPANGSKILTDRIERAVEAPPEAGN